MDELALKFVKLLFRELCRVFVCSAYENSLCPAGPYIGFRLLLFWSCVKVDLDCWKELSTGWGVEVLLGAFGGCVWFCRLEFLRSRLGLAGVCFKSVRALTVSATLIPALPENKIQKG